MDIYNGVVVYTKWGIWLAVEFYISKPYYEF